MALPFSKVVTNSCDMKEGQWLSLIRNLYNFSDIARNYHVEGMQAPVHTKEDMKNSNYSVKLLSVGPRPHL